MRDLVRAGLLKQPEIDDSTSRQCMAALVYAYDHETRKLSKRLTDEHHSHTDLSIATLHYHIDEASCLEVSLLAASSRRLSISPSISLANAAFVMASSSSCPLTLGVAPKVTVIPILLKMGINTEDGGVSLM